MSALTDPNAFPPPGTSQPYHSRAFEEWKIIHYKLASVINDYHAACMSVQSVYSQPPRFLADRLELEKAVSHIDSELSSIHSCEKQLREARLILQGTRNASSNLSPISVLPPELLAHIFSLANLYCCRETDSGLAPPNSLAAVCSSWRRLALNTPTLWSHIDIAAGALINKGPLDCAKLWLRRAGNAPLYAHITEDTEFNAGGYHVVLDEDIVGLFEPHANQLSALDIDCYEHEPSLIFDMMRMWFVAGSPGSVKTLALNLWHDRGAKIDESFARLGKCGHWTLERPSLFLQGVASLRLRGCYFPWPSGAFHGLIELDLTGTRPWDHQQSSHPHPTLRQIADILSASPALQNLRLDRLTFTEEGPPIHPIQLDHLQTLNLESMDPENSLLLLPILAPGSLPLSLCIVLCDNVDIVPEIISFTSRSNTSTLFLRQLSRGCLRCNWLSIFLNPQLQLQQLTLSGVTLPSNAALPTLTATRFPLPLLSLIKCTAERLPLRRILVACSAERLSIQECKIDGNSWSRSMDNFETVCTYFKEVVPRLTCYLDRSQ